MGVWENSIEMDEDWGYLYDSGNHQMGISQNGNIKWKSMEIYGYSDIHCEQDGDFNGDLLDVWRKKSPVK